MRDSRKAAFAGRMADGTARAAADRPACGAAAAAAAGKAPSPASDDIPADAPPVRAERISMRPGKMEVVVALAPGAPRRMTPRLADALARRVPTLPLHTCRNAVGPTFGAVMANTSVPHAVEHLIIDAQCDATAATGTGADANTDAPASMPSDARVDSAASIPEDFLYLGTTEWISERTGRARITVNFADDQIALRALTRALETMNDLLA